MFPNATVKCASPKSSVRTISPWLRSSARSAEEQRQQEDEVQDLLDAARCGAISRDSRATETSSQRALPAERAKTQAEPEEDGLAVDFLAFDTPKIVYFKSNRLGMSFENSMPLVVKRVALGSAAEVLGVERGWTISAINGIPLEGRSWKEALEMLKVGASVLPSPDSLHPANIDISTLSVSSPSDSNISSVMSSLVRPLPDDAASTASTHDTGGSKRTSDNAPRPQMIGAPRDPIEKKFAL